MKYKVIPGMILCAATMTVSAMPVEYVKLCQLPYAGKDYIYIPKTESCLNVSSGLIKSPGSNNNIVISQSELSLRLSLLEAQLLETREQLSMPQWSGKVETVSAPSSLAQQNTHVEYVKICGQYSDSYYNFPIDTVNSCMNASSGLIVEHHNDGSTVASQSELSLRIAALESQLPGVRDQLQLSSQLSMEKLKKDLLAETAEYPMPAIEIEQTQRPVEYLKVCSIFGNEYFYIPETDACLNPSTGIIHIMTADGPITTQSELALRIGALESQLMEIEMQYGLE